MPQPKGQPKKPKGPKNAANQPEDHDKKSNRGWFMTAADGREICWNFSRRNSCTVNPCRRAHICEICRGSHCNKGCPPKAAQGGGK